MSFVFFANVLRLEGVCSGFGGFHLDSDPAGLVKFQFGGKLTGGSTETLDTRKLCMFKLYYSIINHLTIKQINDFNQWKIK